jgi:hypothetical protein
VTGFALTSPRRQGSDKPPALLQPHGQSQYGHDSPDGDGGQQCYLHPREIPTGPSPERKLGYRRSSRAPSLHLKRSPGTVSQALLSSRPEEWLRKTVRKGTLAEFLMESPLRGADLDLER